MNSNQSDEISVVIPVFNEEEGLPLLIPKLTEVLNRLGIKYEVIFVDDGSRDESRNVLKDFVLKYPFLKLIGLRENRGLRTTLLVGIKEARGEKIVTLDSDLQNDPEDIPKPLSYLDKFDMATGWRRKRNDPWLKRIYSKIANKIRNWLSEEDINDSACTLKAFKKECVNEIPMFDGMHRFFSTLVKMKGYKVIEVPIKHHP